MRFRTELEPLYDSLTGEAHLDSLEGWINLTAPAVGQTFLPGIIAELAAIESAFPALGRKR